MTNKEKRKKFEDNSNGHHYLELGKQLRIKYDNLKDRYVAPIELHGDDKRKQLLDDNQVAVVQIKGFSESKDFKPLKPEELGTEPSQSAKEHRDLNTRILDLNKVKAIKEVKPSR